MKQSKIPMRRQHSHPPISILSPTTTAAKAGIKLNDPALRNVAVSTSSTVAAASNNNNVASASTHTTVPHADDSSGLGDISSVNGENGSSAMTNRREKATPSALVRTTSIDKENNHISTIMSHHLKDSKPTAAMAGLNHFRDTGAFSQQHESQIMDLDYHESETMMADDEILTSNGSSLQNNTPNTSVEIRLPLYNDENDEINSLDDLSIDDDDDESDCSGDTVVANEKPPTGLTEEELTRYYWEICYGHVGHVVPLPTVKKCLPTKSCLSTKKKANRPTEIASSMTPRKLLITKSPSVEMMMAQEEAGEEDKTPKNNVTRLLAPSSSAITRGQSAVKFGVNVAAEFDLDMPTTEMKPLPSNIVQERFPNDKVETEKDVENEEFSRETARNVSMLAEWDDDFDSIIDNDDSDGEGEVQLPKRRRKQTPYKQRGRGGRSSSSLSRPRKTRRQSSIFGSAERGRSLLDMSDEIDEDSSSGLPFSVTINPDEYTSPPSSNSLNDSMSSLEMPDTSTKKNDRESMSSTCISPSSLRSGSVMAAGTHRSSSSSSKETPKSARMSSSTILQAVHTSGAFLPTNSPQGNELMPNQLKYSPKESTPGANASFSSSDSLGSDIMSMFTKHSLQDETDGNLLGRQLSILCNHPTEGFHTNMSDLEQCIAASGKTPLQFINDHISKGMDLSTSLSLLNDSDSSDNASMFCGNSQWMTSALSKDEGSFMEQFFELVLRNLHNAKDADDFCKGRTTVAMDPDVQTIASCLKILQEVSSFSWSSSVELSCAQTVLDKFVSNSETHLQEARRDLASFDAKLREATRMISQQHLTSTRLETRKRKASSKTKDTIESIKRLESELAQETERLNACKRAREIFTAHLDVERASPISAISEEIRTTIYPAPLTHNGSDFSFSLLDGMAEVAMNVSLEEDALQNVEIGCFLKDDGAVSISLLKAMLLGYNELDPNQGHGPFPLKNSLQSFFLPFYSSESMYVGMSDLFADATQMFFRIDSLVRAVAKLEREAMCTFNCDHQGNVVISATFATGDGSIRIDFLFRTWTLTTVPYDVVVTNSSTGKETASLTLKSQQQARDVLESEHKDPSLLQRICDQVIGTLAQHGV